MARIEYDTSGSVVYVLMLPHERSTGIISYSREVVPDTVFLDFTEDERLYGVQIMSDKAITFRELIN